MRKRNATEPVHSARLPALDLLVGFESAARHLSLALTDAGQQFYASAAQVLATMRSATERLRSHSGRRRPLSVTTTNSFAALWLIPRLAGFTNDHPEVDVRITAETR